MGIMYRHVMGIDILKSWIYRKKIPRYGMGVVRNGSGDDLSVKLIVQVYVPIQRTVVQDTHMSELLLYGDFEFFAKNSHGQKWAWPTWIFLKELNFITFINSYTYLVETYPALKPLLRICCRCILLFPYYYVMLKLQL